MENWIQRIFLMNIRAKISAFAVVFSMLCTPVCFAMGEDWNLQGGESLDNFKPEVERTEINKPDIDTEDFEFGVSYGLLSVEDFGVSGVFVTRLAYHVSEYIFIEGIYGQSETQKTSFEILNATNLLTDGERAYEYYNLSVGYNLLPGEVFFGSNMTFVSELYVVAGAGSTDFAGEQFFTFNVGLGYRLLLTDEIALHADVRDHMFDIDLLGMNKTSHNIEMTAGLTWFF